MGVAGIKQWQWPKWPKIFLPPIRPSGHGVGGVSQSLEKDHLHGATLPQITNSLLKFGFQPIRVAGILGLLNFGGGVLKFGGSDGRGGG